MLNQTVPLNILCQMMLNLLFLQAVGQGVVLQDGRISAHFLDYRQADQDWSMLTSAVLARGRGCTLPTASRPTAAAARDRKSVV